MDLRYQAATHKNQFYGAAIANATANPPFSGARPLSDIRETTEPNLIEAIQRKAIGASAHTRRPSASGSQRSYRRDRQSSNSGRESRQEARSPHRQFDGQDDRTSVYSIPPNNIPLRTSSRAHKRSLSIPRAPAINIAVPGSAYRCITNRGQSQSPVRDVASRLDPAEADRFRRIPSKTIVKVENANSKDILDHPTHPHPRLRVDLQVAAPLFVGGSSVEGVVRIIVDEAERVRHRKTLTLERISVDLLGIEEVSGAKRNTFLSLGNELVDATHPPPVAMVGTREPWVLMPSISTLPFLITLPLEVGPPPFQSRYARIRYVLCATVTIRDSGRQLCVRSTQETAVLSVYDPEKALMSLPSPLTASDEYIPSRGNGREKITVTAGLHRQVWVSGTDLFADVHIVNNSHKPIKKLELQLERVILCYRHAAAATLEMSASQSRLFDQAERTVVVKSIVKCGQQGWSGVLPHTTDLRTFNLELPRGHATIKCNKHFEVRYYFNVTASTSHHKLVTVQLPIVLIHMNSLDVPTNSVAQVAAAIEEKRGPSTAPSAQRPSRLGRQSPKLSRQPSVGLQGRAFSAPRMRSLERTRAHQEELQQLGRVIDLSPRRNVARYASPLRRDTESFTFKTPPSNRKGRIIRDDDADELRARLSHMRSFGDNAFGVNTANRPNSAKRNAPARASSSAMGFYMQTGSPLAGDGAVDTKVHLADKKSLELKRPKWVNDRWKPSWWDARKDKTREFSGVQGLGFLPRRERSSSEILGFFLDAYAKKQHNTVMSSEKDTKRVPPSVSLIAGGLAGGVEAAATYPFEFAKTRVQLRAEKNVRGPRNPFVVVRNVFREEGLRALYKGCSTLIVGSLAKDSVRFFSFDSIKNAFKDPETGALSPLNNMLAGMSAGVMASILGVTPTERIKTALIDDARHDKRFKSAIHCVRTIYAEAGFLGLYRGFAGTTLKQAGATAFRMGTYNILKDYENTRHIQQTTVTNFANGAVAGIVTTLATQPFDTIKTRSQSAHGASTVEAFRSIVADAGIRGFWRGTTMRLGRTVFSGGILFTAYEQFSAILNPLLGGGGGSRASD